MNYRHVYHAGNFADVIKHVILIILLAAMRRKDMPFCFLDTHAGCGCYDLLSPEAQKTLEYKQGIEKILQTTTQNTVIETYRQLVLKHQHHQPFQFYPGSPIIARELLRPHDQMILSELHPEDHRQLKTWFSRDKQVAVHHQDGYLAMKAFLPPKLKRGLVLMDPPYEKPDEWQTIMTSLEQALQHWRMGVFAIWYPIKKDVYLQHDFKRIQSLTPNPILQIEALRYPNDVANRFNGCGLLILNPPWQIDADIKKVLIELKSLLNLHEIKLAG